MTLYKAWSHPFLSIVGGVGRKENFSFPGAPLRGSICPRFGQSEWKGKGILIDGKKTDGKAQKLLFGQLQDCVLPSSLSFKGYTPHSHQGSQGIDSLAGNPSPTPGRISRGLAMGRPSRSLGGVSAHRENKARPGQQAPDYMPAPHGPQRPGLASQPIKPETA